MNEKKQEKKQEKRRLKKLSDYKGDDAIDLMGELLEPVSAIFSDKEISIAYKGTKASETKMLAVAKVVLKKHKADIQKILLTIDSTPINGMNILQRVVGFLIDLGNDNVGDFFESAEQGNEDNESFGSATENTEENAN